MTDQHNNPLVENIAKVLWESEPHTMLAAAGYPTAWEDQPLIIKRGKWRLAIKALGEFSRSAGAEDVHDRIRQEIIQAANTDVVVRPKAKLICNGSLRRACKPERVIDGATSEITTETTIGRRRTEKAINTERPTPMRMLLTNWRHY